MSQKSVILPLSTGASKEARIDVKTPTTSVADRIQSEPVLAQSLEGTKRIPVLSFPEDRGKYYMTFEISKYQRKQELGTFNDLPGLENQTFTNFMKFSVEAEGMISLPLPQQMTDKLDTDYGVEHLGEIVPLLAGGNPQSMNMDNINEQGLGETVFSAISKLYPNAITKDMLNAKLAAEGTAINKYLTVLAKGPVYKNHVFSWRLSPRNERESKVLRKIIATFNKEMSMQVAAQRLIFKAPKVFQINFVPDTKYLYYFKPAVLQSFKVNYAGNQGNVPSFYRNTGAPESVEMEMTFLELEFWQPEDFDKILQA